MTEPFFKSVLKLSARPLIGFILFLMCCEASAETPYFTNHLAMLKYQMGLKFTNSFEEGFEANVLNLLPANFLTNLLAELNGSNFNALVARVHGLSNQWIPGFRSYLCVEPRYVSVSVLCYASAEQCKRLEEIIRFYVNGRFAGHSQAYLYDAIKECGTYEESEPVLGLPTGLKRRYWIPSKWVERGPDEGVWLVRDGPSFVWQCRHVAASWFYEKRDAKEYDPQLQSQFGVAKNRAWQRLENRGIKNLDSETLFNRELQRVLKEEFHINWLTPEELRH